MPLVAAYYTDYAREEKNLKKCKKKKNKKKNEIK